jgi:hypothetical protein
MRIMTNYMLSKFEHNPNKGFFFKYFILLFYFFLFLKMFISIFFKFGFSTLWGM